MTSTLHTPRLRPAGERGLADHGWLKSRHTFSFADYYDPAHSGFRSLRVINDDHVAPGMGFGTHPHRDMEIFSYVLEGSMKHQDSLGNGRELKPGQIQLMSAGRGVTHSEFNASSSAWLHFLQIWILPRERGLEPSYTEWSPAATSSEDPKVLVISGDGRSGSALIHQDADVFRIRLRAGQAVTHELAPGRGVWLQLAAGEASFNRLPMQAGDGASLESPGLFEITTSSNAEALLFDLK